MWCASHRLDDPVRGHDPITLEYRSEKLDRALGLERPRSCTGPFHTRQRAYALRSCGKDALGDVTRCVVWVAGCQCSDATTLAPHCSAIRSNLSSSSSWLSSRDVITIVTCAARRPSRQGSSRRNALRRCAYLAPSGHAAGIARSRIVDLRELAVFIHRIARGVWRVACVAVPIPLRYRR